MRAPSLTGGGGGGGGGMRLSMRSAAMGLAVEAEIMRPSNDRTSRHRGKFDRHVFRRHPQFGYTDSAISPTAAGVAAPANLGTITAGLSRPSCWSTPQPVSRTSTLEDTSTSLRPGRAIDPP